MPHKNSNQNCYLISYLFDLHVFSGTRLRSVSRSSQEQAKPRTDPQQMPTYKNRFLISQKGIEGIIMMGSLKLFVSRLEGSIEELKQPENTVWCLWWVGNLMVCTIRIWEQFPFSLSDGISGFSYSLLFSGVAPRCALFYDLRPREPWPRISHCGTQCIVGRRTKTKNQYSGISSVSVWIMLWCIFSTCSFWHAFATLT